MINGTIVTVRHDKGYGFINGEDGREYFFHKDDLNDRSVYFIHIEVGTRVEFQPKLTPKGPRAENVDIV